MGLEHSTSHVSPGTRYKSFLQPMFGRFSSIVVFRSPPTHVSMFPQTSFDSFYKVLPQHPRTQEASMLCTILNFNRGRRKHWINTPIPSARPVSFGMSHISISVVSPCDMKGLSPAIRSPSPNFLDYRSRSNPSDIILQFLRK